MLNIVKLAAAFHRAPFERHYQRFRHVISSFMKGMARSKA
jgi:hypothetical protein